MPNTPLRVTRTATLQEGSASSSTSAVRSETATVRPMRPAVVMTARSVATPASTPLSRRTVCHQPALSRPMTSHEISVVGKRR